MEGVGLNSAFSGLVDGESPERSLCFLLLPGSHIGPIVCEIHVERLEKLTQWVCVSDYATDRFSQALIQWTSLYIGQLCRLLSGPDTGTHHGPSNQEGHTVDCHTRAEIETLISRATTCLQSLQCSTSQRGDCCEETARWSSPLSQQTHQRN